jgi:hypothetical protein
MITRGGRKLLFGKILQVRNLIFFRVQWMKTNLSVQPPKVRWHTTITPVFSFSETDFTYEGYKKKYDQNHTE